MAVNLVGQTRPAAVSREYKLSKKRSQDNWSVFRIAN